MRPWGSCSPAGLPGLKLQRLCCSLPGGLHPNHNALPLRQRCLSLLNNLRHLQGPRSVTRASLSLAEEAAEKQQERRTLQEMQRSLKNR